MNEDVKKKKEIEAKPCINGCGQTVKNQGVHNRYCKATKLEEKLVAISAPEQIEQAKPAEKPRLVISDVHQFKTSDTYDFGQLVCWFDTGKERISKEPMHIGIMHAENGDKIPVVLMCTIEGTFLPVFMIEEFIGMFPQNTEWPEHPNDEVETEPIEPETLAETEAFKEEPKARKIIPPPNKVEVPTQEKKHEQKTGLFAKLFKGSGNKEKDEKRKSTIESINLIDEAIKAGNGIN